ncbi:molecular chaperone [Dokdonella sp.]|uniref:fimbrial biogenesis chaperone n=1 Tax=Dokdonella sp. TaxID=2291710 RepID=UPI002F41CE99
MRRNVVCGIVLAALLMTAGKVGASGLQVAPIGLEFTPSSSAQGLWLTNTGDRELRAQVRVFHWTQAGGKDELAASQGLVASPPMLELAPGARQLVRIIRTGGAPSGADEDAFRVLVDELPQAAQAQSSGLQYVLRYSIPVFVSGAPVPDADVAAALQWSLERDGDGAALVARNSGARHVQISDLELRSGNGDALESRSGLYGYVLPGITMRWPLTAKPDRLGGPFAIKAKVNGKAIDQALAVGLPR